VGGVTASGLDAFHLSLGPDQFEALVEAVADRIASRTSVRVPVESWFDVEAAATYLACKPKRIYDLKAQGRLRYAKDGTRLLFRREWLDGAISAD
jgi:excisionase family DNA binding protein